MYKISSNGKQRALDHGRVADWVTWDDDDTPQQKLDSARLAVKRMQERIDASTGKERTSLGLQKLELQKAIKLLKKEAGEIKVDLTDFIIQLVKERMGRGEWLALVAAARRLHDQRHGDLPKTSGPASSDGHR